MIDRSALKGEITKAGLTQAKMAEIIGITPKTFYTKMAAGVFGSDEIEIMVRHLNIKNPWSIFFASYVTPEDTNKEAL